MYVVQEEAEGSTVPLEDGSTLYMVLLGSTSTP